MQKKTKLIDPDEFPEWHNKPLRLTIEEMKEPLKVIAAFFDFYDIREFRFDFKEMLHSSFHSTGCRDADFVHLYDLVEKLVEANWIIIQTGNVASSPTKSNRSNYVKAGLKKKSKQKTR